jgi:hypothetical protein
MFIEDDSPARDVSGNGHDGILLKDAAIVKDSERGYVLQINQSGMRVNGPFNVARSFTLSARIKIDQPRIGRDFSGGPWSFRTGNEGTPEHYWLEFKYPGNSYVDKFDTRSEANPLGQLDGKRHHYFFGSGS